MYEYTAMQLNFGNKYRILATGYRIVNLVRIEFESTSMFIAVASANSDCCAQGKIVGSLIWITTCSSKTSAFRWTLQMLRVIQTSCKAQADGGPPAPGEALAKLFCRRCRIFNCMVHPSEESPWWALV